MQCGVLCFRCIKKIVIYIENNDFPYRDLTPKQREGIGAGPSPLGCSASGPVEGLGVACSGATPAPSSSCEASFSASGDQGLMRSSEWFWMASDAPQSS